MDEAAGGFQAAHRVFFFGIAQAPQVPDQNQGEAGGEDQQGDCV